MIYLKNEFWIFFSLDVSCDPSVHAPASVWNTQRSSSAPSAGPLPAKWGILLPLWRLHLHSSPCFMIRVRIASIFCVARSEALNIQCYPEDVGVNAGEIGSVCTGSFLLAFNIFNEIWISFWTSHDLTVSTFIPSLKLRLYLRNSFSMNWQL